MEKKDHALSQKADLKGDSNQKVSVKVVTLYVYQQLIRRV